MRLRTRNDLGGYAAAKVMLDVEVTKPFVLLCGPNGSGKTSILRMLRMALGLLGERGGRLKGTYGDRPVDVREGDDDLGRLAAMVARFGGSEEMPRDRPGVLDVGALGWRGQRTWLFDSKEETLRLNASAFDEHDFSGHLSAMVAGRGKSHGESLRHAWMQAMWFAAGLQDHRDPYDKPELPPHLAAIRDALFGPGPRPVERWLLVDEPETAVDANTLMTGLSVMLEEAGEGNLRVFCASHSPVFAAGLADHPKVQAVEVGPEPWLARQKAIFDHLRDPDRLAAEGRRLSEALRDQRREARERAEAEAARERRKEAKALPKRTRDLLLAALEAGGTLSAFQGEPLDRITARALEPMRRGPPLGRYEGGRQGSVTLTEEGMAVAALLRDIAAEPKRRAGARKGAASPADVAREGEASLGP